LLKPEVRKYSQSTGGKNLCCLLIFKVQMTVPLVLS
jgi:hypothetical protein